MNIKSVDLDKIADGLEALLWSKRGAGRTLRLRELNTFLKILHEFEIIEKEGTLVKKSKILHDVTMCNCDCDDCIRGDELSR